MGLWSSVTDTRPIISLLDMLRSDSATKVIDFSVDKQESTKPKPKPNKDRNPYYGDLHVHTCLLYTSPSPRDQRGSRMPSSA